MGDLLALEAIKPSDLPSPPQAAISIMRAASRETVNSAELSRLAASDPVLTAELLRFANSPFFGLAREVQSLPRAVTVLGHRTLRNLALCLSVRDALRADAIEGFDHAGFWEDMLLRAVAARVLGERAGLDPDECFTAGLLQDFGLLVIFALGEERAAAWPLLRVQCPDLRRAMEQEQFGMTHDAVGDLLARTWDLPGELSTALGGHHECAAEAAAAAPLARVLYCADWMTAVYRSGDKGYAIKRCRELLERDFALDRGGVDECLAAVAGQAEAAAAALGLRIEQGADFNQVLAEANRALADQNIEYQQLTLLLEKTLKERDRLARELHEELERAREIQQALLPAAPASFPVTGINVPARQLSGDFYDHFTLPDGRIYFNLGDVSGKGVNAALLMVKTCSLFRCLGKREHDPSRLLAMINAEICETTVRGMFVTLAAGLYDPAARRVLLANAGHMPALLLPRAGNMLSFPAQGPPLGVEPQAQFPARAIELGDGALYLYSDGATEARLDGGAALGVRGLARMILDQRQRAPRAILEALLEAVARPALPLRDDVTFVLVDGSS